MSTQNVLCVIECSSVIKAFEPHLLMLLLKNKKAHQGIMVYCVDVNSYVLLTVEDTAILFFLQQYNQVTDVSNFINSEFPNYKFNKS